MIFPYNKYTNHFFQRRVFLHNEFIFLAVLVLGGRVYRFSMRVLIHCGCFSQPGSVSVLPGPETPKSGLWNLTVVLQKSAAGVNAGGYERNSKRLTRRL